MKASNRKSLKYRGSHCLNCGYTLKQTDVYCPQCSQLNSDKVLTASDFFNEFLSSIFVYDSRVWTTLRDLVFRPGVITRNYVKGQRLKYANPFRFFLSVSILYFLLKGILAFFGVESAPGPVNFNYNGDNPAQTTDSAATGAEVPYSENTTMPTDTLMAEKLGVSQYFGENSLDTLSFFEGINERIGLFNSYYATHKEEKAEVALEKLNYQRGFKNKWLYSRVVSVKKILRNPKIFITYLRGKSPFLLFFFAPVFALAFRLFYSKKHFSYMEHIIFIFHIFSFVFLIMLLFLLPETLLDTSFFSMLLLLLIGPVYFFIALSNFYGQRFFKTLFKFIGLSIAFNIGFFVTALLFVTLGAAVY